MWAFQPDPDAGWITAIVFWKEVDTAVVSCFQLCSVECSAEAGVSLVLMHLFGLYPALLDSMGSAEVETKANLSLFSVAVAFRNSKRTIILQLHRTIHMYFMQWLQFGSLYMGTGINSYVFWFLHGDIIC